MLCKEKKNESKTFMDSHSILDYYCKNWQSLNFSKCSLWISGNHLMMDWKLSRFLTVTDKDNGKMLLKKKKKNYNFDKWTKIVNPTNSNSRELHNFK